MKSIQESNFAILETFRGGTATFYDNPDFKQGEVCEIVKINRGGKSLELVLQRLTWRKRIWGSIKYVCRLILRKVSKVYK